jgi:hypothetical protein
MNDNIDRSDTRSSRPDAVLLCEELLYSGKAVTEDCLDAGKWLSGCYSPESEFEQY